MAEERKMFRLEKLSPEVRATVLEEIAREEAEDRLRRLVTGNKRLMEATAEVTNRGGKPLDVITECLTVTEDRPAPAAKKDGTG